jgi:hypothetical protein
MENGRPAFMESSFSTQDARSSGPPQTPRVSEVNLVEEMRFLSALDGVTVSDPGFVDVSMIEEVYAITKRNADRLGTESDASDARVAKKVVQNVQPSQPAVRVVTEAVAEVPLAGPSSILKTPVSDAHEWASRGRVESSVVGEGGALASAGEWRRVASRAVAQRKTSGVKGRVQSRTVEARLSVARRFRGKKILARPSASARILDSCASLTPVAGPSSTLAEAPIAGPSEPSILERPRAAAYSRKQPVVESSGQTKLLRKEPSAPAGVIRMMVGKPEFDFVAFLKDTAVAGLTWGDRFVLAPRVKRDVARQLVQARTRTSKGKQKVQ